MGSISVAEYRSMLAAQKARPVSNSGRRDDLGGLFVRSGWEANVARYFNMLMKMGVVESWEYEPQVFWFLKIKRGVRSYLPDFRVKYRDESQSVFVEVKGYLDAKSKTKIARFRRYYPEYRLDVIGAKEYRAIRAKWSAAIPNWEGGKALRAA